MQSERVAKQKFKSIDWITILLVTILVVFGLLTLLNVLADPFTGNEQSLGDFSANFNLFYVQKQAINFLVGFAAMLVALALDYNIFRHIIKYVYFGNVLLLAILVFTTKVSTRGVFGWFYFGSRAFQPSEICKITLSILLAMLASDAVEREGALRSLKDVMRLLLYFAVPFVLVLLQPDFGTAIVFVAMLCCILFVSKISWKYVATAVLGIVALAPLVYMYLLSDDQRMRIQVFIDPSLDVLDKGLQVASSKTSIGSGQLTGKGYFTEGTLAQLKFVPERHTDFVFSGIGEGLGFIGGCALIVLYFALIFRWLWVALHAKDHFGTCIVVGLMGMMLAHVFENIGMTIGLMPVTGIPLPFISYGGSNVLTSMIAVGLVLNVWMRRQQKR